MEQIYNQLTKKNLITSVITGLAFFYIFIQLNLMASLNMIFAITYHLSSPEIGFFSGAYLMGIAAFVIPAGLLIDRYGPYRQLIIGLVISTSCTFILANNQSLFFLIISRIIGGMSHIAVFLSCIRIITESRKKHLSLFIGIVITVGLLGGILTQYPFVLLRTIIGWHHAINLIAIMGIFILLIEFFYFKNLLNKWSVKPKNKLINLKKLINIIKNPQNFLFGLFACLMDLPAIAIGTSWGNRYLTSVYHTSTISSSKIILWVYIGLMIGSPLSGWLSDYYKKRKIPMIISSGLLFLLTFCWATDKFSLITLSILTFLIGIFSGFQILSYTCLSETNNATDESLATGYASLIMMGGNAILMPFIGWLMKLNAENLSNSFLIIPLLLFINILIISIFMKDSFSIKLKALYEKN